LLVHAASVQDRDGAKVLLQRLRGRFPRLELLWADGSYAGDLEDWSEQETGFVLQIVRRPPEQVGFAVLPKRWIVERTFGWWGRFRRLSKDDEELPASSEALIRLAMIHLMVRRLAPS
jgi:putative transposase